MAPKACEQAGGAVTLLARQPTVITGLLALTSALSWTELAWFDLQLRLAMCAGALAHEHAHLLTALLCGTPRSVALTVDNLLGHVPLRDHLLQLLPGARSRASTRVELADCASGLASLAVAASGLLASLAILAATTACPRSPLFWAASLNAALALVSDGPLVLGMAGSLPLGVFGCGNWGLLIPANDVMCGRRLLPRPLSLLLEDLLQVVELRGGQAGGVCFFYNHSGVIKHVINKVVKAKRGPLGSRIFGGLGAKLCRKRWKAGFRLSAPDVMVMQGHTRFGTSSPASVPETHPHQWIGERTERFWKYDATTDHWQSNLIPFCVTICHNGDFDEWKPYDNHMDNKTLGLWLSRVLNKVNPTKGDSPKLAGVMDLLVAKGVWFRSVRFAYTLHCMTHEEQVCGWESLNESAPKTMPTDKRMRRWAEIFENSFKEYLNARRMQDSGPAADDDKEQGSINIEDLAATIHRGFQNFNDPLFEELIPEGSVRGSFVTGAIRAFMQQDILTSVWQFFCNAVGTFGISVSCTAYPNSICLAAKGQPISVGFNRDRALVVWTSEPVSLPASWVGMRDRAVLTRWDLSDSQGEILEVMIEPKTVTPEMKEKQCLFPAIRTNAFSLPKPYNIDGEMEPDDDECDYHIVMRGCDMSTSPTPFTLEVFNERLVEMSFTKMDSMELEDRSTISSMFCRSNRNPVRDDIQQIPFVIKSIDNNWTDKESLNVESARKFAGLVCQLAEQKMGGNSGRDGKEIDILLTGVETSLWVGQQFIADLSRCFPMLNCVAISSNFVLGILQKGAGHVEPLNFPYTSETFKLKPGCICLALSHSGATYPTVWAARLLKRLNTTHVFAMSGHLDTTLSASLGQNLSDPSFNGNIFWTMAGVRPSESASVATIAMHHSLTHLLTITLGKAVDNHVNRGQYRRIKAQDVADLSKMFLSLCPAVEKITGYTTRGEVFANSANDSIVDAGKKWSSHLTEPYWATFFGALYVYITVTGSVPVVTTIWKYTGEEYIENLPEEFPRLIYFLDATIYVFLAALISIAHRKWTGRRLWTRYTARTVVIVDSCTMNYKILRAYVSKLRALAFRFTTFGVLGQNPTDHFVHEMTHLTTSDALVAVGRPDGRLATLAATEASVIMSLQQAKFIKKGSSGIEAISIGHNPWTNPKLFKRHCPLPMEDRPVFYSEYLLSETGDPEEDRFEGATPDSVLSKTQGMYFGKKSTNQELAAPRLTLDMLQVFLGGRQVLSKNEARIILKSLVEEQADALKVHATDFDPERLIPKTAAEASNKPWASGKKGGSGNKSPRAGRATGTASPAMSPTKSMVLTPNKMQATATTQMRLTDLMTIVRSQTMVDEVLRMKTNFKRMKLAIETVDDPNAIGKEEVFLKWKDYVMKRRNLMDGHAEEVAKRAGDWRMLEAYRTAVQKTPVLCFLFGATLLKDCFHGWVRCYKEDIEELHMVGESWSGNSATPLHTVLDSQVLLEQLYETRVAAAERLVSFFVLFYHMVRPISKVPFLGFAMDKTESRLRVASTPAPIAMREPVQDGDGGHGGHVDVLRQSGKETVRRPSVPVKDASGTPTASPDGSGESPHTSSAGSAAQLDEDLRRRQQIEDDEAEEEEEEVAEQKYEEREAEEDEEEDRGTDRNDEQPPAFAGSPTSSSPDARASI